MMKKLICLTLAMCLLLSVMPVVTFADDGAEFSYFTDFESYTGGEGTGPDSNWGHTNAGGNKPKFRPATETGGNRVMQLDALSEPTLWFGQMFTSGRMHMTAYIKTMGNAVFVRSHGGESAGDGPDVNEKYETNSSKYILLNPDGTIDYYETPVGWVKIRSEVTYNPNEWIRVDIITSEMSETSVTADYYVNEVKVNPQPVVITEGRGMKGLFFKHETKGGTSVYIDNVAVERFFGEKTLGCTSSDKTVPVENGVINVKLSEVVNTANLVPENITIKNIVTGQMIENFSLTNITETGFTVNIEETLEYGRRYSLMLSDVIKGRLSGASMKKPLEFLSENKTAKLAQTVAQPDFDDFDPENGETPEGFVNLENVSFSCDNVPGKSGAADDFAWGITSSERNDVRFMYELDELIPKGAECEVSFDCYCSSSNNGRRYSLWNLYLAEPGDFNTNNTDYKKNLAILFDSDGSLKYADTRTDRANSTDEIDDSLTATFDEWNSVKLKVKPTASGSEYTVSINGGSEYTVSTSRSFSNGISGFGFGYYSNNQLELKLDNVKLSWSSDVEYPEVNEIILVDVNGNETAIGQKVTSMISGVYVDFTADVDFDSAKTRCVMREDGRTFALDFENDTEDKSRIKVVFPELLNPNMGYVFTVFEGVASAFAPDVASEMPFEISFKTRNDTGFRLLEADYDEEFEAYKFIFAKNNAQTAKLFAAAGVYENVVCSIDGIGDTFEKMTDFYYLPINVSEADKGVFEYLVPISGDADKIKAYLCIWPDLIEVSTDINGNIQL